MIETGRMANILMFQPSLRATVYTQVCKTILVNSCALYVTPLGFWHFGKVSLIYPGINFRAIFDHPYGIENKDEQDF